MPVINPEFLSVEAGQDIAITMNVGTSNITGWTFNAYLRTSNGATPIVMKTVGTGIVVSQTNPGVIVITFTAADTTQPPGSYVWEVTRSNAGFVYPVVEPSSFLIRSSSSAVTPTLTNLSELQTFMQLGSISDAESGFYLQLLALAETAVQRICGRQFVYDTYTEYLDGEGTFGFLLRETPVLTITSLYVDTTAYGGQAAGAFAADKLLTQGVDFYLDVDDSKGTLSNSGRVARIGRRWPNSLTFISQQNNPRLTPMPMACPKCVKVIYTAGYRLIPMDLKAAVFQIVADRRDAVLHGEKTTSGSFEGGNYSLGSTDDEIRRIGSVGRTINNYKRSNILFC